MELDLNGFTIDRAKTASANNGQVLTVLGNLILSDSVGSGVITGGYATYAGGVYVKDGTFIMNGGSISGNTARAMGGGIYAISTSPDNSRTNIFLNAGKINNNSSPDKGQGGGVGLYHARLFVEGGEIINNSAYNAGGVRAEESLIKISKGRISNNTSSTGGGVFASLNTVVTMLGGEISGNTATVKAGGLYVTAGAINIAGAAVVAGNMLNSDADNIYLENKGKITIGDGTPTPKVFTGNIGVSSNVAVTLAEPLTIAEGYGASTGKITSDDISSKVLIATGTAQLVVNSKYQVTHTLNNIAATADTSGADKAAYLEKYTTTLTPSVRYSLPQAISVVIGGVTQVADKDYDYTPSTGVVTINADKVSQDITITAAATKNMITDVSGHNVEATYNGKQQRPTIDGIKGADNVKVKTSLSGEYGSNVSLVNAGYYTVYYLVERKNHFSYEGSLTVTINKATYDISGISLSGKVVVYDGNAHSLAITGTLPSGLTAVYEGNNKTNHGEHTVSVRLVSGNDNYHDVTDILTADITINKATYDMGGISLVGKTVTYDGNAHSLAITGTLPSGLTAVYEGNAMTSQGIYDVSVRFINDNDNYNDVTEVLSANMTILAVEVTGKTDASNAKNDVIIDTIGGIAPDVFVVIKNIPSADHGKFEIGSNRKVNIAYNIVLMQNDKDYYPEYMLKVRLLMPNDYANKIIRLQHYVDGNKTDIEYKVIDGYAVFNTTRLGDFVFSSVVTHDGDGANDNINQPEAASSIVNYIWIGVGVAGMLMLLGLMLIIICNKRNNERTGGRRR